MGLERKKGRRPGPRILDRISLFLSDGQTIDGLWVGTFDDKPEPVLRRLRESLSLIKAYDRLRYERLTRDLKRVWATAIPLHGAYFDVRLGACVLNARFVVAEMSTPEQIAAAIVHEATHARLMRYGIGYEEKLRSRVEAICLRRELAFLSKLPNGQQAHEWAEQGLVSYCDPANLTNDALDRRYFEEGVEELRQHGVPDWVIRLTIAPRSARRRVHRIFEYFRGRLKARVG